jgi:hypothetical protein
LTQSYIHNKAETISSNERIIDIKRTVDSPINHMMASTGFKKNRSLLEKAEDMAIMNLAATEKVF